MLEKNKVLHLFTSEYPYGEKSETFIETEIIYLSEYFEKVIIYPKTRRKTVRNLPINVTVNSFRSELNYSKKNKLVCFLSFFKTSMLFLKEEFVSKKKIVGIKFILDYLSIQLIEYRGFRSLNFSKNDQFYDYWFSNATLALAIAKRKGNIVKYHTRAHAFDIYDELWGKPGVPFRYSKIKQVSKVFVISDFGYNYFLGKIPSKYHDKLSVSFLGVNQYPETSTRNSFDKKIIVSCSSVTEGKGVIKTIGILKKLNTPVHWIHFGSGPQFNDLSNQLKELPFNITVELRGHIPNIDVIAFYQSNAVDLFLSLSESEGIPVSMMEAISFGIPITAYSVGGVPEIVKNNITGLLFDQIGSEHDIINSVLTKQIQKSLILDFYLNNFNANKNYPEFISRLC